MAKKIAVKSKTSGKIATKKPVSAKNTTPTKTATKAPKSTVKITTTFKQPLTKNGILAQLAESTGIKKSDIKTVFESLESLVECHIGNKGSAGVFTMPGLFKIQRINRPAKKARKGINPFTGEETEFKAKPAHSVVKIRALKKLKEMVAK